MPEKKKTKMERDDDYLVETHEEFMKKCFGDDFWERPEEERFIMGLQRCLRVAVTAFRRSQRR